MISESEIPSRRLGLVPNDPYIGFRNNNMGTFSGRVGRYCPSSSGARARVRWSGTWYSLSGLFLGAIRGLENIISFDRGTCPVGGWSGDLGTSFLRRGACGWPVAASLAPCSRMWAWERGGTNRSDIGLNLSGSWQQGHSATYNTPSRT